MKKIGKLLKCAPFPHPHQVWLRPWKAEPKVYNHLLIHHSVLPHPYPNQSPRRSGYTLKSWTKGIHLLHQSSCVSVLCISFLFNLGFFYPSQLPSSSWWSILICWWLRLFTKVDDTKPDTGSWSQPNDWFRSHVSFRRIPCCWLICYSKNSRENLYL